MVELVTNASSRWPRVTMPHLRQDDTPEADLFNHLLFVDQLDEALKDSGSYIEDLDVPRLVGGGVLEVPVRVKGLEGEFDVFFYPRANDQAIAHYMALLETAEQDRHLRPIFYSPGDVLLTYPNDFARIIHYDRLFIEQQDKPLGGQYAMWWSHNNELFETSLGARLLERIILRTNGHEAMLATHLMGMLGATDEPVELPEQVLSISVRGPERLAMMISFSIERGVRFHFHIKKTLPEHRDRFLRHVLNCLEYWLPEPLEELSPALLWWQSLQKRMLSMTVIDVPQGVAALGSIHQ